jgi:geranylgeranyl diphosphate synthase, type II
VQDLKTFWQSLDGVRQAVDERLDGWLPAESEQPERLHASMRYSIFAGGKRVRPILDILACRAVGGSDEAAMPSACALECVHTYSLIHDDLPAMDDDDLRRGRPSNHKAFDEATAILSGDALLTLAFEIITTHTDDPAVASRTVNELARASGWAGMVGGQEADLLAEGVVATEEALRFVHERKTGALIRAAVRCGAIAGGASDEQLDALTVYAEHIGLAFQIADDILDETATSEQLGKTAGKDKDANKLTFPAVYGLEQSRAEGQRIVDAAKAALEPFGDAATPLSDLADFIISRTS